MTNNILSSSISNFIINNSLIFLGLGVMISGLIVGVTYEFDHEMQNAEMELKKTSYVGIISIMEFLMVSGYWTMIIGGILLSLFGYSLKEVLK